ncbi:MAG: hypothetical protein JW937_07730, partial [Candidatus Omnitrophica bacterium]|nr:hypothetical protein [Candidatus Omnitrophota bacterium]
MSSRRALRLLGILLVGAGLLLNEWLLALIFSADGQIAPERRALIWALDLSCIALGLVLIQPRYFLPRLLLLLISLGGCFLVAEIFLRMVAAPSPFHPGLALHPYQNRRIQTQIPGVRSPVQFSTNKWGMRGDPIPADWSTRPTILAVGGSTTLCLYLSDESAWPAQLQQLLKPGHPDILVQNAGLDGHSTQGHLLMMRELVPKVRPKLLVFLVGVNDLSHSLIEKRLLFGNPYEKVNWRHRLFVSSRVLQLFNAWQQVWVNRAPVVDVRRGHHRFKPQPAVDLSPLPDSLEEELPS